MICGNLTLFLIVAALKVSIRVTYTIPDQSSHYNLPNFRAASSVTLHCIAEGASGYVEYRWSLTCRSCFASNSYSASISEQFLRSRDTGEHTCTVRDGAGNSGSYTQEMNITGLTIVVMYIAESNYNCTLLWHNELLTCVWVLCGGTVYMCTWCVLH